MKIITYLVIIPLLIYAGVMSYYYFDLSGKNKQMGLMLNEARNLRTQLQGEVTAKEKQQEEIKKENEQLKKETLDYLKYQKENNKKREQLEKVIKDQVAQSRELRTQIEEAKKQLGELQKNNLKLSDISDLAGNIQIEKQQKKIIGLEEQLGALKERFSKQESLMHYNLGVSYVKERNYELAIDEYEKALSLNPEDADTHYNLGIIYDEWRKNPRRALEHYKKYLELKPDAADIDEVKDWINRLEK